jgi:formylmethanofuran dehydrogenase subunit D
VLKSPIFGGCFIINVDDADAVVLYLAESIKVELTDEGGEVIVFKVLRDDVGGEYIGVFD